MSRRYHDAFWLVLWAVTAKFGRVSPCQMEPTATRLCLGPCNGLVRTGEEGRRVPLSVRAGHRDTQRMAGRFEFVANLGSRQGEAGEHDMSIKTALVFVSARELESLKCVCLTEKKYEKTCGIDSPDSAGKTGKSQERKAPPSGATTLFAQCPVSQSTVSPPPSQPRQ